jgi:hypothetical protein
MFGNLRGWIISVVLLAGLGWLCKVVYDFGKPSRPIPIPKLVDGKPSRQTISPRESLVALALPVSPGSIVQPTVDGIAGDVLREALRLYREPATLTAYERFTSGRRRDPADYDALPKLPIDKLIEAGAMRQMRFLSVGNLDNTINFDTRNRPELNDLQQLTSVAMTVANYKAFKPQGSDRMVDAPGARRLFEALFLIGQKLFDERVVYDEMQLGLELMAGATGGLMKLAEADNNAEMLGKLKAFDEARVQYVTGHVLPIWRIVSSIDNNVIARHAGNVFLLAMEAEDRMWRVEGLLKLGRYRYNAGRPGDQSTANRVLKQIAASETDPVIQHAAVVARDLTSAQYNLSR